MPLLPMFAAMNPNNPLSQMFGQVGTIPSLLVNRDPLEAMKIGARNGAIAAGYGGFGVPNFMGNPLMDSMTQRPSGNAISPFEYAQIMADMTPPQIRSPNAPGQITIDQIPMMNMPNTAGK